MSDAELIARLRRGLIGVDVDRRAADRIEALTKERDEADDLAKAAFADGASNNIRLAETSYRVKWLEAKLAKAVEVLNALDATLDRNGWHVDSIAREDIRATLATIKGDKP